MLKNCWNLTQHSTGVTRTYRRIKIFHLVQSKKTHTSIAWRVIVILSDADGLSIMPCYVMTPDILDIQRRELKTWTKLVCSRLARLINRYYVGIEKTFCRVSIRLHIAISIRLHIAMLHIFSLTGVHQANTANVHDIKRPIVFWNYVRVCTISLAAQYR